MESRWKYLSGCHDFNKVFNKIKRDYIGDYTVVLDQIEKELEDYENSTEDEWQEVVENKNIPFSVQWYEGMIDTDYFLNECWL